ncbi:acyl-CoA dehydrogenase family protein [Streptomyces sp. NPDC048254]|uniref:acyl-CoA dehydrogenase family protein n=1 Tax=Streptomyces sp. NPDC048254 TaxID=3365525 RepID=UPI00371F5AA0
MDFAFSDEQEELRDTVRSFLGRRSTPADVRRLMADARGYDEETWRLMAGQLGLQGLALPEEYGGSGFGLVELGVVMEEMGRALLCGPFLSSAVLAAQAVLASADRQACKDLLPGIASGETVATLAVTEQSGHWTADGIALSAEHTAGEWRLTGRKYYVPDGHVADLVLVAARTAQGVSLFAVDANAPGLTREALPTLDLTRKQAMLDFQVVPARLLGADGAAWPALRRALDIAVIALAVEQVGGAFAALDMAVDYAKTRVQFGRVIGSFQAVKHQCADMLVAAESARATAHHALWAAATDAPDLRVVASGAKAYCSEAFTRCAEANVQIHGGIGFTWEHSAHLYLKRAKSAEIFLGAPREHRELLAQAAGF